MVQKYTLGVVLFAFIISCSLPDEGAGNSSSISYGLLDYEGKVYKTVAIGEQVWFAENLNYKVEGSKCYKNLLSYCDIYGRLYDWETALTVCPDGWHLPSDEEWAILTDFVGSDASIKLRATKGWNSCGGFCLSYDGTDEYGFSALPGGHYSPNHDIFLGVGDNGYWWSATEATENTVYFRTMDYGDVSGTNVERRHWYKTDLYSVRCIQD